jgi:hypothetical protein
LDQFLEHLLEVGIEKIIRIGSQSKSKLLEGKNLRVIAQSEENKTRTEKYILAMAYKALEEGDKSVKKHFQRLNRLQKSPDWQNLREYLRRSQPRIHSQFSRVDDEGFETVGREPFDVWATTNTQSTGQQPNDTPLDQILVTAAGNVWSLASHDRDRLIQLWADKARAEVTDQLYEDIKATEDCHRGLDNVHNEVDRRILQSAEVIGITTSTLARRIATLEHVRAKIIIVEEAGEVLEAHMLSALLPSIEHVIAIGDHQQLRPQINNYNLSLESQQGAAYQLDRSQFERLSVGERGAAPLPVAQLSIQRRMRPDISTLIRETIYPRLIDHEATKNLPKVVGIRDNVFWFDHDNFEDGSHGDHRQKSHSNLWEVDMVSAVLRHVIRQGVYSSTDIAVLTPYSGQLQKLRAKLRSEFEIVLSERDQETLEKDEFAINDPLDTDQGSNQIIARKRPLQKKQMTDLLRYVRL